MFAVPFVFYILKKNRATPDASEILRVFSDFLSLVASVTSVCLFDKKFGLFGTKLTISYNYHLSYICALQQSIYREKRWKREELQVNLLAPDRERERETAHADAPTYLRVYARVIRCFPQATD